MTNIQATILTIILVSAGVFIWILGKAVVAVLGVIGIFLLAKYILTDHPDDYY